LARRSDGLVKVSRAREPYRPDLSHALYELESAPSSNSVGVDLGEGSCADAQRWRLHWNV